MNLSRRECDQRIGPQTKHLRTRDGAGETAAEVSRLDARDANGQSFAGVGTGEKGQANAIADLEPADVVVQLDIVDSFVAA